MSSTALAVSEKMPAHIKLASSRGNENVGANVQIPRIKLLQMMNKETIKSSDKYVDGAEPGHFYNTLTQDLTEEVYVISVTVKTAWKVWQQDRKGTLGEFPTREAAELAITDTNTPHLYFSPEETDTHLLLIKDAETGALEPAIMDFSKTKLWVSRNWNSTIGSKGGDRFASVWKMGAQTVENDKGTFFNLKMDWLGWAQKADFDAAESLYEQHAV